MKTARIIACAALGLTLAGCSGGAPGSGGAGASAPVDDALPDVEIISAEAAAAEAEATITEANADAAFDALEAELDRELAEDGG